MANQDKDSDIVKITQGYIQEAKYARQSRMDQNQLNFESYHMRQDFSHKMPGQSRETLGKQSMAVEQITSFIQQGLVDQGEWFGMETNDGVIDPPITEDEAKKILTHDLESVKFISTLGDSVKLGLLQSLMIVKPHGEVKNRSVFYSEAKEQPDGNYKDVLKRADNPYWSPKIDVLRAEDYFIDPTGSGLYRGQQIYMDWHDVKAMSKGDQPLYRADIVDQMGAGYSQADEQNAKKANETGQNATLGYSRKRIKLYEFWGKIVNSEGDVLHEDVYWTIADDKWLIQKPTPNPFWHGQVPYVTAAFIRVPHSEWGKGLMDGPTRANNAMAELYNLMVDDGMNSVHGIKTIRTDWLEDDAQISNGITPGMTLKINSQAPVGAKPIEVVPSNGMSAETMNVYQMMNAEFSTMALTNDLRMGVASSRPVKATEVVEASQSITGVMTGISKVIEANFVEPILYQMWANRLQHMDQMYKPDLDSLVGEERSTEIMAMSKEDLFAKCVDGFKFKVFGVSRLLSKQKDFRKITALLQTLSSDPPLMEEFMKEYSTSKLLGEFMRSLDISIDRIKLSKDEKAQLDASQQQAQAGAGMQPGQGPDMQSQIPQAAAAGGADGNPVSSIPQANLAALAGKAQGGAN